MNFTIALTGHCQELSAVLVAEAVFSFSGKNVSRQSGDVLDLSGEYMCCFSQENKLTPRATGGNLVC